MTLEQLKRIERKRNAKPHSIPRERAVGMLRPTVAETRPESTTARPIGEYIKQLREAVELTRNP